jgi:Thiamine pyrophosphate enzyme, C-terminal TPP binding domain
MVGLSEADHATSVPARKPRSVWPSNPAAALWSTMVGKKVVMAVTGAVLVAFVVAHMLGNLKIFLGADAIDTYAVFLRTMGDPLFPYSVLLWVVRIVLLTCVALHVTAAVQLTRMSWAARPDGYDMKQSIATTYAARTTRWSRASGVDFGRVDVVLFAQSFGAHGLRIDTPDQIAPTLEQALAMQGPVVIGIPVDYRDNHQLAEIVHPTVLN